MSISAKYTIIPSALGLLLIGGVLRYGAMGDEQMYIKNMVKQFPPHGSSAEVSEQFEARITPHAEETQVVYFSDECDSNPVVAKLPVEDTITLVNDGTQPAVINVNEWNIFEIQPGSKVTVVANFPTPKLDFMPGPKAGVGIYGYRCNNSDSISGIFMLTEKTTSSGL